MREWVPVPGTTRGDLVRGAVGEFAARGYEGVRVGELAHAGGVTTGALYHHFGSKQGLYEVVRHDIERRVLDRMEGAAHARADHGPAAALRAALLAGFDWATAQGMARLLSEPHPDRRSDPLAESLARIAGANARALAIVLIAAWRAALHMTTDGLPMAAARDALNAVRINEDALGAGRASPS